jgi:hypothetical protein
MQAPLSLKKVSDARSDEFCVERSALQAKCPENRTTLTPFMRIHHEFCWLFNLVAEPLLSLLEMYIPRWMNRATAPSQSNYLRFHSPQITSTHWQSVILSYRQKTAHEETYWGTYLAVSPGRNVLTVLTHTVHKNGTGDHDYIVIVGEIKIEYLVASYGKPCNTEDTDHAPNEVHGHGS